MEAVFLKLLNMSIAAGWLVLAVVALRFLLKKAPKAIRCVLWALVGIRLICPFSFESALSLIPSAETINQDILYSQEPAIHTGISALNRTVNPVISDSLAPSAGTSVNPLQVITSAAAIVWIIGIAILLAYAAVSYHRLRRRVCAAMRLRDHLWLCDDISSPFILGFFKPRVYLPSHMDETQLAHVIAHENAHIRRRDHWWKPIGFILLTIYWFNPLMWLAYILLCRDIELACDEKVVREMETAEKKAYSEALLSCSVPQRIITACPLAFGEVGVKERIRNVLSYKKPAFWIIIAAVAACVILAVCFLTNPKVYEKELKVNGIFYSQQGENISELPADSTELGALERVYHRTPEHPEEDYSATNIDAKYAGCPIYQSGNAENTVYLYDYSGFYIPYVMTIEAPFGHSYSVAEITYDAPQYSFAYTPDAAPQYCLTADYTLMVKDDILDERASAEWLALGSMTEVELTKANFDRYFENNGGNGLWQNTTASQLRRNNEKAWFLLDTENPNVVFYYLLRQENGDAYLSYGYYDPEGETDSASDDSSIRWLFKLTADDEPEGKTDQRPTIIMDGQTYINPYMPADTLPDGYVYAGELTEEMANGTGLGGCRYYTNPENPDDFYVYQECGTPISSDAVDPEQRQWAYMQWIAEDIAAQTIVSEYEREQTDLDLAVSNAILEHNKRSDSTGDFACESHVILGTAVGASPPATQVDTVIVYAMVLYQEYTFSDSGIIKNASGGHIPAALTFDKSEDGAYTLTEYWEPRDGAYYGPDIKARFPESTWQDAFDTQKYILTQIQNCYAQAVEYGKVDTDAAIAGLLETICSSPAAASAPSAYIDAHPIEYRELTYYGDYTLRYVFSEFLKGGQTGLKGHIMRIVMDDLIGGEALGLQAETGQAYFDEWLATAHRNREQYGDDYMEQSMPKAWMLLQMAET